MGIFPKVSCRRDIDSRSLRHSVVSRSWAAGSLFLFLVWTGLHAAISPSKEAESLKIRFTNVARKAGLNAVTVFGGKETNKYLLETTGCGIAFLDYNNDSFLDVFRVNGSVLEGFPKGQEPANHLYMNRGNGTFEDVTQQANLVHSGWGQGVCVGDYDNDGYVDLFISDLG